jgi:pimeloyl-ACP methyl ester carboxylesterase
MSDASAAPTIVLVHGAFADASGWSAVYDKLKDDGNTILAPPNPLRGVAVDAAYIRGFVEQIDGPVLLVGHSYGGAVITVAGDAEQVVGLVYVAGFAPDAGENLGDLQARVHRFSYGRAGATIVEVEGASHAVMLSHPQVVADTIRQAMKAVSLQPVR